MGRDILLMAAQAYKILIAVEYHIVLGRKGNTFDLNIVFMPENFYHLAGFHKLKQRYSFQQRTSTWILEHILNGTVTSDVIASDKNFSILEERLYSLKILEQVIDAQETKFYSYDKNRVAFATRITADYLAKGMLANEPIVFSFFVRTDKKYCMNSIFQETAYDYSTRQTQYTVLLKEKKVVSKGLVSSVELYRHNKYAGI